jgi:uncharacterized membrane protein YphA (DoxX/SURF4 family)
MNSAVAIAQIVGGSATLGIFITAFAAAVFAFIQVRANRANTRESSAYKIFEDYMMLAFNNPRYSRPDWEEQYSWYVGSLLWACDEVLSSMPQTEIVAQHHSQSCPYGTRFFHGPRFPKG